MKSIAAVILAFLTATAVCAQSQGWLTFVPDAESDWRKWHAIPQDNFFEVPASRLAAASAWLANQAAVPQEAAIAAYFGRPSFRCSSASRAYLIRALYINGGTGNFGLHWSGPNLVVSHASLGAGSPPKESVLVACLDRSPLKVYSSVSSAK